MGDVLPEPGTLERGAVSNEVAPKNGSVTV